MNNPFKCPTKQCPAEHIAQRLFLAATGSHEHMFHTPESRKFGNGGNDFFLHYEGPVEEPTAYWISCRYWNQEETDALRLVLIRSLMIDRFQCDFNADLTTDLD
jgi:hypothetical protein